MVTDLRVSHDILSQKISVKDVEDDYFRASIKEIREDNWQFKERIVNLQEEYLTQNKINRQLKKGNHRNQSPVKID